MICYRDMTFCDNPDCTCPEWRRLTPKVWADAMKWWEGPNPPVASADLCGAKPPTTHRLGVE